MDYQEHVNMEQEDLEDLSASKCGNEFLKSLKNTYHKEFGLKLEHQGIHPNFPDLASLSKIVFLCISFPTRGKFLSLIVRMPHLSSNILYPVLYFMVRFIENYEGQVLNFCFKGVFVFALFLMLFSFASFSLLNILNITLNINIVICKLIYLLLCLVVL